MAEAEEVWPPLSLVPLSFCLSREFPSHRASALLALWGFRLGSTLTTAKVRMNYLNIFD